MHIMNDNLCIFFLFALINMDAARGVFSGKTEKFFRIFRFFTTVFLTETLLCGKNKVSVFCLIFTAIYKEIYT